MAIVDIEHVTKTFRTHPGAHVLLGKGGLVTLLRRQSDIETVRALDDVSLSIELGECIGIAGSIRAGKTTLLRLIAGITVPTSGKVTVLGRVAPLIDLDAGFHPSLTGRDNIYFQARLLGLSRKETGIVMESICDLAGLGPTIDRPVASYSPAMRFRLAFAIAANASPDIYLIDDALAQADDAFQKKCRAALDAFRKEGKTIVLVTDPAIPAFSDICDRIVTMKAGKLARGTSLEPVEMVEVEELEPEPQPAILEPEQPQPAEPESTESAEPQPAGPDTIELIDLGNESLAEETVPEILLEPEQPDTAEPTAQNEPEKPKLELDSD